MYIVNTNNLYINLIINLMEKNEIRHFYIEVGRFFISDYTVWGSIVRVPSNVKVRLEKEVSQL